VSALLVVAVPQIANAQALRDVDRNV